MELKSENTSRISGVPNTSRNRKESRTVVEAGKGGMCRSWGQSQSSRADAAASRRPECRKSPNIYMLLLEQASEGDRAPAMAGLSRQSLHAAGRKIGVTLLRFFFRSILFPRAISLNTTAEGYL